MSEVRAAGPDDAEAVAAVHVQAWRETYAHLLSPRFLGELDVGRKAALWRSALARNAGLVQVALVDGAVVGFSSVREARDAPRDLELAGIYLLAAHHGTGLGQRLLDAALADRPAFLWVAEDNAAALRFYARNGFRPDGARQVVREWEDLVTVRLVR